MCSVRVTTIGAYQINLNNENSRTRSTHRERTTLADIPRAADKHTVVINHGIGGAHDAVWSEAVSSAVVERRRSTICHVNCLAGSVLISWNAEIRRHSQPSSNRIQPCVPDSEFVSSLPGRLLFQCFTTTYLPITCNPPKAARTRCLVFAHVCAGCVAKETL